MSYVNLSSVYQDRGKRDDASQHSWKPFFREGPFYREFLCLDFQLSPLNIRLITG